MIKTPIILINTYSNQSLCIPQTDSTEMEFGDWEYLNANNLSNSQISEENSSLVHEQDQQHQVVAKFGDDDQGDVQEKEITQITEECDAVQETQLQALDEANESKELDYGENEVLEEENSKLEFSRSVEFEEVEEVEEVDCMETIEGDCESDLNQKNLNWRVRGIKVLSSVGIAAATLSIIILGGCKRGQNRELQIQIYADDKV